MSERKFNFVYLTTNLIDGKQYVGEYSTDDMTCAKTKNYIGSGVYIARSKKIHGRKNFIRKNLEFFPTKKAAFDAQEKYITQFHTLVPAGYNISPKGGLRINGCHSQETKDQISRSNKGKHSKPIHSQEYKDHMSKRMEGNFWNVGKTRSEELKKQIRDKTKNVKKSEETKKNMKEGWKTREPMTDKTKERMSLSKKQLQKTCPYCNLTINIATYNRWHNNHCKFKDLTVK